jgi:hypothetical protein
MELDNTIANSSDRGRDALRKEQRKQQHDHQITNNCYDGNNDTHNGTATRGTEP